LRLAVVSPFVDRRHGTERVLAEQLERLAFHYGCEIHLYAQHVADLEVSHPQARQTRDCGVIVWHRVPSFPGPHIFQFLAWLLFNQLLRRWHRLFRGPLSDLVLSPGINCFDADVILVHAVFQRFRELWREEESSASLGFFRNLHRRMYYWLITYLERLLYAGPRVALATVSHRTAGQLSSYFHRHDVLVIPNGVDTAIFSPANRLARRSEARAHWGFSNDDFVLLLIGNAWHAKGLVTILEALAALPEMPLHLMIVGSDAADPFRQIAQRLGVLDRCHWETPDPDVLRFYATADLYVGPSREDPFGLPVLEAMACGLPAITSANAGVSELIRNGVDGFILQDPRDSQELVELIRRLYASAELRNQIGESAAETARQWTWDRNAAAVFELLQEYCKRKQSQLH
jgi:glycosyltransferase involved in cell wall biosynthesis